MTKEEQIKLFENKILEKKDIFLNSNEENVFYNYSDLMTLEYDYRKMTGNKQIIDDFFLYDFYINNKQMIDVAMKDSYLKSEAIKDYIIDTNLNQLRNVAYNIYDTVFNKLSYKTLDNLEKIKNTIDNTNLNYNDIDNIINDYLKNTNYKYKDLYNNLKEQGLVFFLDTKGPLGSCYNENNVNSDYSYIIINKNQSIISMCLVIAHELGHIIDYLELKEGKNITQEDLYNYCTQSVLDEVIAVSHKRKCIDYLDNIGIDKNIIKKYRIEDFFDSGFSFCGNISKGKKDLYSIRRTYAFIINNYTASIIFKNKKEKIKNIFNEERLLNNDINILNKLNCNEKNIKKSTIKSLKKIL